MQSRSNCSSENSAPGVCSGGSFQPGPLIVKQPQLVKRWAVAWDVDGDKYCLIGPWDFIADLAAALEKLFQVEEIDAVTLWPCVRGTPRSVYVRAIMTVQKFVNNRAQWGEWQVILDRFCGYELPDVFELNALWNEGRKAK